MIDAVTKKPLSVTAAGTYSSYIAVPLDQLKTVLGALDTNSIGYWVEDEVLSIDGKPEIAFINLADGSDPASVQLVLDSIP